MHLCTPPSRLLRTVVALEPQNLLVVLGLGRTLQTSGHYGGAELAFIALDSDYARGYEQRALNRAITYEQIGSFQNRARSLAGTLGNSARPP
jgi:hypothetical protein